MAYIVINKSRKQYIRTDYDPTDIIIKLRTPKWKWYVFKNPSLWDVNDKLEIFTNSIASSSLEIKNVKIIRVSSSTMYKIINYIGNKKIEIV